MVLRSGLDEPVAVLDELAHAVEERGRVRAIDGAVVE
jgi:hypothetical protein